MAVPSGLNLIRNFFPELNPNQCNQFDALEKLYRDWNQKVNVISRKDVEFLVEKHILHSLAIAKFIQFKPETRVMDIGTGGGFPGIPLSIIFPESQFILIDSIGKKIKVVEDIIRNLQIQNAEALWMRAEDYKNKVDFIVSRAVAPFPDILRWSSGKLTKAQRNTLPNGIILLKGGDLESELGRYASLVEIIDIQSWFPSTHFEGKKLIYYPA